MTEEESPDYTDDRRDQRMFYSQAYDHLIAPGFADFDTAITPAPTALRLAMTRVQQAWHAHTRQLFPKAA